MSTLLASWLALTLAQAPAVEQQPPPSAHELPFFGVQVDAGAPDGLGASLVVTPFRYFRLHAGGLTNGVGSGVRLGVEFLALPRFAFRPLIGLDGGYVFGGLGAWLPQLIQDTRLRQAVTNATVGFVNGQIGFELGSEHVALTLRVGLSYVDVGLDSQVAFLGDTTMVSAHGIALRGFIPSARVGFIFCFD